MTFVSLARRIAFVHVPRAGGTSVLEALRREGDGLPLEPHLRAVDLRARLGEAVWDGLESIAVVRESLDWFWSKWRYIRTEPLHRLFVATRGLELSDFCRLAPFVTKIGARQVDFLCDRQGAPLVRHVLRFETLAEDWARLAATLPIPEELPRRNARPAPPESPFDAVDRRRVLAVFAEDAIRLGLATATEARAIVEPTWRRIAAFGPDWFDRPEACSACVELFLELGEFDAARYCAARAGDIGIDARIPPRPDRRVPWSDDVRAFIDRIAAGRAQEPLVSVASLR